MPAQIALINPRRKRRSKRKTSSRRRRHVARRRKTSSRRRRRSLMVVRKVNPRRRRRIASRRRHRRARNPRLSIGGIASALIPAVIGGAGAVGVDIGVGYLSKFVPVPAFLQSGYGKVALQVGAAFGMGFLAKKTKLLSADKANAVVLGALTVAAYGLVRNLIQQAAPTVPGLAGDFRDNMGAYMPNGQPLGYVNPSPYVEGFGAYMQQDAGLSGMDGMGM